MIQYGVSQIDGGTKIELGSYSVKTDDGEHLNRGQFRINDGRTLNEIIDELLDQDMIPSFCTACYRLGRTGEHFMEFSVPGFIKRYCTPNAILTLGEYLLDYAPENTVEKGWKVIHENMEKMDDSSMKSSLYEKLDLLRTGKRDLYF
jgi:2-iminoacetate synthase